VILPSSTALNFNASALSGWTAILLSLSLFSPAAAQANELAGKRDVQDTNVQEKIVAQAIDVETTQSETSSSPVSPRLGAGFSTSGAGFNSFGRLNGFIPLRQAVGHDLTYLDGQLLVDVNGDLGGNVLVGHRVYDEKHSRIWGGYLGYDKRGTNEGSFDQIGLGLETLGEVWDVRVNGYLPVGDVRQTVASSSFDTGLVLRDLAFQGNRLVLESDLQQQSILKRDAALAGFDAEAGGKLLSLGNSGALRGYGGLYHYGAEGSDSFWGWRLRLEAQPNRHWRAGLALQNDTTFGTNVTFSIGASLPVAGRQTTSIEEQPSALDRIAEAPRRNPNIILDRQTKRTDFSERRVENAINPDTGAEYNFQHVQLGANGGSGGNGTTETPFGNLSDALATAQAADIVYVQAADVINIPGFFSIPDGVALLSSGPEQQVTTQQFGQVTLPGSDSGNFPLIDDTVSLENDTTIAGFRIENTMDSGIEAISVNNVTIRDNQIDGSALSGVFLQNVTGTVEIANNRITQPTDYGVEIEFLTGTAQDLILTGNEISEGGLEGILINVSEAAQVQASLENNTLSNNGDKGIAIIGETNSAGSLCVALSNNASDTDYELIQFSGLFQVTDLDNISAIQRSGSVSQSGNLTNVAACE